MQDNKADSTGRVVMVSGAGRGIGFAIASRLEAEGYHLSLGLRNTAVLGDSGLLGERVSAHAWDALGPEAGDRWVAETLARHGRIDALVNNAGILRDFDIHSAEEADLDAMWEVNVKAPLRLIRAAYPHLKQAGNGRVVNIASLSGKRVKSARVAGYAMTKHALVALTHAVRYSGWDDGVRATAICPGFVATDMTAEVTALPAGDMTQPESIAALVSAVLGLPNNASVVELPVNSVLEHSV